MNEMKRQRSNDGIEKGTENGFYCHYIPSGATTEHFQLRLNVNARKITALPRLSLICHRDPSWIEQQTHDFTK